MPGFVVLPDHMILDGSKSQDSASASTSSSVRVSQVVGVAEAAEKLTGSLCVTVREQGLEEELLVKLREIVAGHTGPVPLYIELRTPNAVRVLVRAGPKLAVRPDADCLGRLKGLVGEDRLAFAAATPSELLAAGRSRSGRRGRGGSVVEEAPF